MPEGPEVRREADRIAKVLIDRPLETVFLGLERLKPYTRLLTGSTVIAIETKGKALLTHFDNGYSMYSHNQLYGKWQVCKRDKSPETNRILRVALHTAEHSALLYSASEIEILETDAVDDHPFISRLGPDVLNDELHWRDVATRLSAHRFRGRSVAALFLNQHFIAGIGNYLRSEILFAAGVHPFVKPRDLNRGEIGQLARSTLEVSLRAYATAGVTTTSGLVKRLKAQGFKRRDYRFAVFGRDGLSCHSCGETVIKQTATSRRLYYCPHCQSR